MKKKKNVSVTLKSTSLFPSTSRSTRKCKNAVWFSVKICQQTFAQVRTTKQLSVNVEHASQQSGSIHQPPVSQLTSPTSIK